MSFLGSIINCGGQNNTLCSGINDSGLIVNLFMNLGSSNTGLIGLCRWFTCCSSECGDSLGYQRDG